MAWKKHCSERMLMNNEVRMSRPNDSRNCAAFTFCASLIELSNLSMDEMSESIR